MTDWLTREEIDHAIDSMSAADVIEAVGDGKSASARVAGDAFNSAALAVGLGEKATRRVQMSDFQYLANKIGESINIQSPLPEGTGVLPDSAATGE